MWHVTCDTWHVTHDAWHMTRDTWHVTRLGGWTFSQNFSSLALIVCDLWYYEDLEEKDDLITELINHEAVYRTAPATPGLLNTLVRPLLPFAVTPCLDQSSCFLQLTDQPDPRQCSVSISLIWPVEHPISPFHHLLFPGFGARCSMMPMPGPRALTSGARKQPWPWCSACC